MSTLARPVCVLDIGSSGLACTIGFAELGWRVHAYDIRSERIARLRHGVLPSGDPGVSESLRRHVDAGTVHLCDDIETAARDAEVIVIAAGTAARDGDSYDLRALHALVERLAAIRFATWPTIVVRSAVAPGTCDALAARVASWADLIYAPEFAREGSRVNDFLDPNRIIIGTEHPSLAIRYVHLLEGLQKPVFFTSRCNAELIKNGSDAFVALKIGFANEIASMCVALGATSDDVLRGIEYGGRSGAEFLRPGIGRGESRYETAAKNMVHLASRYGARSDLLAATVRTSDALPAQIVRMLESEVESLGDAIVGVWGFASGAASRVIDELGRRGTRMLVYDPFVRVAPLPAGSRLVASELEATHADALLVLTGRPEFGRVEPRQYAAHLAGRLVIDGCNTLDACRVAAAGLNYRGVGIAIRAVAPSQVLAEMSLS